MREAGGCDTATSPATPGFPVTSSLEGRRPGPHRRPALCTRCHLASGPTLAEGRLSFLCCDGQIESSGLTSEARQSQAGVSGCAGA